MLAIIAALVALYLNELLFFLGDGYYTVGVFSFSG